MREGRRDLGVGASGPVVAFLRLLRPPQQLIRPEPFPGQHFPHHPVDCGLVIRGIFSPKPVAGSAGTLRPASAKRRGDARPPRACPVLDTGCGSRTRPVPRRSYPASNSVSMRTLSHPRRPGSPGEYPPERWTGSSGVRCRPGSGGKWPSGCRRLPPAGWTHPLRLNR